MMWIVGIGIFLLLLFSFPRQTGVFLLVVILFSAGLFGWLFYKDHKRIEEHRREKFSILISAEFNTKSCTVDFPISISITNTYSRTLQKVSFELAGYREGYSSPIYRSLTYKSDRIIRPGETYVACWAVPNLEYGAQKHPPEGLIWRPSYSHGDFN